MSKGMTIVTGFPRSGTSLMMRILLALGLETPAGPFNSENEQFKELNPEGFYELPLFAIERGLNTDQYSGQAVKLLFQTFIETKPQYIDRVIVMERNREEAARSFMKLWQVQTKQEPSYEKALAMWDEAYEFIWRHIEKNNVRYLRVGFEHLVETPGVVIDIIANFLGVHDSRIENAVNLIRRM